MNKPDAHGAGGQVHVFPIRVYYQDTDAGGVVYHATYLNFAERARTEFLRSLGFNMSDLVENRGLLFSVHHIEVDYHRPARLDDSLDVRSRVTHMGGASFTAIQQVWRGEDAIADIEVRLVLVGKTGRPVRIPDDIRTTFNRFFSLEDES